MSTEIEREDSIYPNRLVLVNQCGDPVFDHDTYIVKHNPETIDQYLDSMVAFLRGCGFTFVHGLAVLDEKGEQTWVTEL